MKRLTRRTLAMILCILAVFSLFPVTADAADSYSMLSSKKVKIKFPAEYYNFTMTAKVKGGDKGKDKNSVYLVPRPETGNGDMGTIKNGSRAVILAEEDNYYFWMTTTGKLGWTNKKYFTEPEEVYYGYLWGESGLSVDDIDTVKYFLQNYDAGYASKDWYANRAVLVMKKGETKKISFHSKWTGRRVGTISHNPDYTTVKQPNEYITKINVKAKKAGASIVGIDCTKADQEYYVLVIAI